MNKLKRFLALFLVLCMMLSVVPFGAFASESTEPTGETTEPVADATEGETGSTEAAEETQAEASEETQQTVASTEAPVQETEAPAEETEAPAEETEDPAADPNAGIMMTSDDGIMTTATTTSDKPVDGTNAEQPFPVDLLNGGHYRIPALWTLSDGTLVAAADARWHTWDSTDDNGDIDTIVSYSKDNGATWNYTFANYIDNGNTENYNAATFIDPAIAAKDGTIYMLVDLFPGQSSQKNCTGAAQSGTGYDSNGNLLLKANASSSSYGYYLSDGKIYATDGTEQSGYTVDAYFNLSKDGEVLGNLFTYSTSYFQPLMTSYLYLTKSTDGGATWSEPQMLNTQIKNSSETFFIASPGRGIVTSDGTIIFPCYGNSTGTCLIYSVDNGVTWERSEGCDSNWSNASEAEIVELEDGTLRMFVRHSSGSYVIRYVDITKNSDGSYSMGSLTDTSVTAHHNTNITAISYSKTSNGQQVILVACPGATSGTYSRYNGKIFTFTIGENNAMTLVNTYEVNGASESYSYSCLTELNDGSIGLLYEKGDSGNITYVNYNAETITGLTFDAVEETPDEGTDSTGETTLTDSATDVTVTVGEPVLTSISVEKLAESTPAEGYTASVTYSIVINDEAYTDGATVKIPYDSIFEGCNKFIGTVGEDNFDVSAPVDGYFTVDVPHFSNVTISGVAETVAVDTTVDVSVTVNTSASKTVDGHVGTDGATGTLSNGVAYAVKHNTETVAAGTKYTLGSASTSITTGTVVIANGTNSIGNSGTSLENVALSATTEGTEITDASIWTVTASGSGYTISKVIDGTTYYLAYSNGLTLSTSSATWSWNTNRQTFSISSGYRTYYLRYNNGWTTTTSGYSSTALTFYSVSSEDIPGETIETTTVTFTAPAEMNTTVSTLTLDNVAFNVSLVEPDVVYSNVILKVGATKTISDVSATIKSQPDEGIATAAVNGNELTITGVAVGKTELVLSNYTGYRITVAEDYPASEDGVTGTVTAGTGTSPTEYTSQKITQMLLTRGVSYDLNKAVESGQTVTWESDDESVVTVDENGTVTAQQTTGSANIYVTVYDADGAVVSQDIIPVQVINGTGSFDHDGADDDRLLSYYNEFTLNCTAYFTLVCDPTLEDQTINGTAYNYHADVWEDGTCEAHAPYECGELYEMPEGMLVYGCFHKKSSGEMIAFFASPDEGYALTDIGAVNSSYFHPLKDENGEMGTLYDCATEHSAINRTSGAHVETDSSGNKYHSYFHDQVFAQVVNYNSLALNEESAHTLILKAIKEYDCDGGFFLSRNPYPVTTSFNVDQSDIVHFVAQKLPEMEKTITSIEAADGTVTEYESGMSVAIDETINYTITVYVPDLVTYDILAETDAGTIAYSDIALTDPLTGDSWSAWSNTYRTGEFTFTAAATGKSITMEATAYTYTTSLKLTTDNFSTVVKNGIITNTANLTYAYQSTYSRGTMSSSASAEAKIVIEVPSYVIDFGLPVTMDLSDLVAVYGSITSASSANGWGSVAVNGSSVTYTPSSVLQNIEYINLSFNGGGNYAVAIYPATTVYYEEGFITWNGWQTGSVSMGSGTQATQVLGKSTDEYGYDSAYVNGNSSYANATDAEIGTTGTFTFTGTGFDVYANCDTGTGYVAVQVKDASGTSKGLYMVNTVAKRGSTAATDNQDTNLNSLPIVSVNDLEHGAYTVTITKVIANSGEARIDGVRIYNTVEDSTVFEDDLEDNPEFYQLRDMVLHALTVDASSSPDQVYGELSGDTEEPSATTYAAVLSANAQINAQDLLDNGPKNELFLWNGETLAFSVKTSRLMQIGLKAPSDATSYTITIDGTVMKSGDISSSTDMFYELGNTNGTEKTYNVVIENTGSGILSVTDLKICDDPNASFVALDQEDIETALVAMGLCQPGEPETEPTEPETEPTEPETEPTEPETEPTEPETEPTEPETEPTEPETEPTEPEKPSKPNKPNSIFDVISGIINIFKNIFGSRR